MDVETVLKPVIAAANSWFAPRETDYIENGILMCGVCHKTRQFRLGTRLVPCLCACDEAKQAQEQKRREVQRARDIVAHSPLYDRVFDEIYFQDDKFPGSKLSEVCRQYVEKWEQMRENNQGLLLYGQPGGGKTFYAACIVNELRKRGVTAQMVSVTRLLMALDNWEREPILDAVKAVPLLVLDDVGAERETDYQLEKMFSVVDARIQSKRPLIVTTNMTPGEMQEPDTLQKTRIYSRLWEACAVRLRVDGNKRPGIAQDKAAEARQALLDT